MRMAREAPNTWIRSGMAFSKNSLRPVVRMRVCTRWFAIPSIDSDGCMRYSIAVGLLPQSVLFQFFQQALMTESEHFCRAPFVVTGLTHRITNHLDFENCHTVLDGLRLSVGRPGTGTWGVRRDQPFFTDAFGKIIRLDLLPE